MIKENTLNIYFILLILFTFNCYAESGKLVADCTDAMSSGQPDKALVAAETALKQDAANHEAWLCKGRALGAQGQYTEAQKAMEQGIKGTQSDYDAGIANLLLGNLHRDNQAFSAAIASYQKSLTHFQKPEYQRFSYIAHMLLGKTYTQNKDMDAALASFQAANKAANNDNERAESHAGVASAFAALGQYDKAVEQQLKSALMQKKAGTLDQYADAMLQLGQYQTLAKDYKNADLTLNRLRAFAKENGGAYYEAKASLLMAQNDVAAGDKGAGDTHLADAERIAKTVNDKELNAEIAAFAQTMQK